MTPSPDGVTIVAAAALVGEGLILSLPRPARHHDINGAAYRAGIPGPIPPECQGFLTSDGRWLNRVDALAMANAAGQIVFKHPVLRELYSEDMW